jgi:hypothetical protein
MLQHCALPGLCSFAAADRYAKPVGMWLVELLEFLQLLQLLNMLLC